MQAQASPKSPQNGGNPDSAERTETASSTNSPRSEASKQIPPVFRFVENISTQPVKIKETEIAARRAHSARVSHQRRRERLSIRTSQHRPALSSSTSSTSSPEQRSPGKVETSDVDKGEKHRALVRHGQQKSKSQYEPDRNDLPQAIARLDQRLDQSNTDPFNRTDLRSLPRVLRHALEYALQVYWPTNVNSLPKDQTYTLTLRRASAQNQYAFHAIVAAAVVLLQRSTKSPKVRLACSALIRLHRTKAIRLINDEIDRLHGRIPSDDLVVSIVAIASEPPVHEQIPSPEQLSKSPLATAQNLHYYSTQSVDPEYTKAFVRIIELKGGLAGIQSPALATLTELFDLMVSSMTGSPPRYAWRHPHRTLLSDQNDTIILDPLSMVLLKDLGRGFDPQTFAPLFPILSPICELIFALDRFVRNEPGKPSMYDFVHARNAIQHSICTLPHISRPENIEQALQEICRNALLCFSDMVIFPIPEQTGNRSRLVIQHYTFLRACEKFAAWQTSHFFFLLWATTIGCVASANLPFRSTFSTLLSWALSNQPMSWSELKDHLTNFIWWDYICDELGKSVYAEAMVLTPWSSPVDADLSFAEFR